ncbi:MAG: T9SS type A sorting domain-containing protein [Bacteroidales bacterium]
MMKRMLKILNIATRIVFVISIFGFGSMHSTDNFCNAQENHKQKSVFNSEDDGSWADDDNWNLDDFPDYFPTNTQDDIYVNTNITLNSGIDIRGGTSLEVDDYDTLVIDGSATFRNGSLITVDEYGVLIIYGDVTNNNNSDEVQIDGQIIIDGDFYGGNGSEVNGSGDMIISGEIETDGSGSVFGSTDDCVPVDAWDCSTTSERPLPVELVCFNASLVGRDVHLSWETASEINNDHFIIDRSTDMRVFSEIAIIDGNGNSSTNNKYSWEDTSPAPGINYYRLTQVDFDGTKKVYNIVTIIWKADSAKKIVKCFPNPFVSDLNIDLQDFENEEINIAVYDNSGQQIHLKTIYQPNNEPVYSMNLSNLNSGVYYLKIAAGNYSEVIKCVKK